MELERTWGGVGSAGPPVVMSEDLGSRKGGSDTGLPLSPPPPSRCQGMFWHCPSRVFLALKGLLWLLPGSAREHGMRTSSWAGNGGGNQGHAALAGDEWPGFYPQA